MLTEFKVRFFDTGEHKEGWYAIITAINQAQAEEFAYNIVNELWRIGKWKDDVDVEFLGF